MVAEKIEAWQEAKAENCYGYYTEYRYTKRTDKTRWESPLNEDQKMWFTGTCTSSSLPRVPRFLIDASTHSVHLARTSLTSLGPFGRNDQGQKPPTLGTGKSISLGCDIEDRKRP